MRDASFSYPDHKVIFDGLSFSLEKGEILCILGANGAGKSTLLNSIGGLFQLSKGDILFDGQSIRSLGQLEIAKRVGYVPQSHLPTFPYSVFEFVLMGRTPYIGTFSSPSDHDRAIAEEAIETIGIAHLKHKPYTEISGGEMQLAMFARVVAQQPELLLLDEPTSHLDFGNQIRTLELIGNLSQKGFSVIITSHFPDHSFLLSNKIGILKDGRIIDIGSVDEMITEENMKKIYGIDVRVAYFEQAGRKICVPLRQN